MLILCAKLRKLWAAPRRYKVAEPIGNTASLLVRLYSSMSFITSFIALTPIRCRKRLTGRSVFRSKCEIL